jgi:transposase-like protein
MGVRMTEGGIFMTKKEGFKYQIVEQFLSGKISRREAAELLQMKERNIAKIARRIEKKGFLGASHGNRGKDPWNKFEVSEAEAIVQLVKEKYFDFNMTHCLEFLREKHRKKLSYEFFRRLCHKAGTVKRKQKRRPKIRQYRVRMQSEGMLLQMDGSHHAWNGKDMWVLIGAIDDATSDVPHAEFFKREGTMECLTVMRKIIEKKGIPLAVYVDKAGWAGGCKKKHQSSQFQRACSEMGTRVIFANSPEAKGRIERFWGTLQDRLIPEMRIRDIKTIEEANRFLQEEFLPGYWKKRNTIAPVSRESKYRKSSKKRELEEIFCVKEIRKVKPDHTIQWHTDTYRVTGPFKRSLAGRDLELRFYPNGKWRALFQDREVKLEPYGMKTHYKLAA